MNNNINYKVGFHRLFLSLSVFVSILFFIFYPDRFEIKVLFALFFVAVPIYFLYFVFFWTIQGFQKNRDEKTKINYKDLFVMLSIIFLLSCTVLGFFIIRYNELTKLNAEQRDIIESLRNNYSSGNYTGWSDESIREINKTFNNELEN